MELTEADIERFWSKVDKRSNDECWNWKNGIGPFGYGMFWLKDCNELSHRVALVLSQCPQLENKLWALHRCKQNRKCCNPLHLYWGDTTDNMLDRIKDGTSNNGEQHGLSKLTEQQVKEIRQKYIPHKYTMNKLATEYNVSKNNISRIIYRKTWTHLID